MNFIASLFKIFYAGTMSVYPNVGMFGSNIIQGIQACHRLGTHFGWFNSSRPVSPGPQTEQGAYAWHQDALVIMKSLAPVGQRLLHLGK